MQTFISGYASIKKLLFLIVISVLFVSCDESYVQVVYTKAMTEDIDTRNSYYVYENDKVRVVYDFWALGGKMQFYVYNKHDKPIYIDWSKSAFIKNDKRFKYYNDNVNTTIVSASRSTGATAYGTVQYGITRVPGSVSIGDNVSYSSATTVREEQITFIPPKSSITKYFYGIASGISVQRKDVKIREIELDGMRMYEVTPKGEMSFRNFVTYSTSKQFATEEYIDNGFYVTKLRSMKIEYFNGNTGSGWEGDNTYPFFRPTRFYVNYMYIKSENGDNAQ